MPRNFVEEPFCFRKFLVTKNVRDKRGGGTHDFPSNCFVSQCREISSRNPSVFQKILVSKNFMPKMGLSQFSIENLVSHSTEKLRRTLLCFTKFLLSKKLLDKRGREGLSRFSVKNFLSHSAEKFRRGTLSASLISGIEKLYASEVYVTILCRLFCLIVPKIFLGESFSVSLISGIEKC